MVKARLPRQIAKPRLPSLAFIIGTSLLLAVLCATTVEASVGDRSDEFRHCLQVCQNENCQPGGQQTPIPLLRRLLLWDCPSECDYSCQHIVTAQRLSQGQHMVQFHGKWPFNRLLGMQEPFSVVCSALNLWANIDGLYNKVRRSIPSDYTLRPYYEYLAYVGIVSWSASVIFHMRDFAFTEQVDYFAAGASVLFGLYYTVVHHFRLDKPSPTTPIEATAAAAAAAAGASLQTLTNGSGQDLHSTEVEKKQDLLRQQQQLPTSPGGRGHGGGLGRDATRNSHILLPAWTTICILLYTAHVAYLKMYKWDYGYNIAANTAVGMTTNLLWTCFSIQQYRRTGGKGWTLWPIMTVVWVLMIMSLELFDFPPLWGAVDAHSLWHLGTAAPTVLWYNFLVKDAQDDISKSTGRLRR